MEMTPELMQEFLQMCQELRLPTVTSPGNPHAFINPETALAFLVFVKTTCMHRRTFARHVLDEIHTVENKVYLAFFSNPDKARDFANSGTCVSGLQVTAHPLIK
jgi:hypothetical protein